MLFDRTRSAQARVLSGSAILLTGSGLVTAINFAYNVAVAHFLGPAGFAHATAVYTLLILLSAVTLSFQIVSAKVVALQPTPETKIAAYQSFHYRAWICGAILAALLVLLRGAISAYLRLPGPSLVAMLAAGIAFYVPLGVRRGYIQGACSFQALAANLVLEGFARLMGSLLLIALGFGVEGVIAANAGAVAIAYLFAIRKLPRALTSTLRVDVAFREGLQAIVFFVGQVAINNCDIVVVKHFFTPASAGLYAAIALVGRVVYAFCWAIVSTMFPVRAGQAPEDGENHGILATSTLLVFAVGVFFTLILRLAPSGIWTIIFGSRFEAASGHNLPSLLALYAATTAVYSLSVVIIAYEMSYKIANTGWVQLAFSVAVVAGLYRYHDSLEQVILVQLVLMVALLAVVAVPFFWNLARARSRSAAGQSIVVAGELRMLRRVSEDEVMSEFLKSDFHCPEFKQYQAALAPIVESPDLENPGENQLRRALLFIRHGSLWRELPKGTDWFEVEVTRDDLERIRVFPRAHWRKLARGDYGLIRVVQALMRGEGRNTEQAFLAKIESLRDQVRDDLAGGAVLLIGLGESGPFTVLDGNHRLVAATLVSPAAVRKFRFFCGISPRMAECCWYRTNFSTLLRYGANLLRHVIHDPEAELTRLLRGNQADQLATR